MFQSESPLGDYLRARRALIQPEDVGLVTLKARRVVGLRRDEVATRAGISQEYYLRLEQGRDRQPSDQVLRALGRALLLDDDALEHMTRLTRLRGLQTRSSRTVPFSQPIDAGVRALLGAWDHTPGYVMDGNQDVLAANDLARAMAPGALEPGVNLPLLVFSDAARAADPNWRETAERTVATLRFGADPDDPRLREIVGQLSIRDADFRRLWARHDARPHYVGPVDHWIPPFGRVTLVCQTLLIPGQSGELLVLFHAAAGSVGERALASLGDGLKQASGGASETQERSATVA
ncbi:helix-turn-helix domain-containing protein [Curtobacterium sp. MCBA15_008]|uniref:helix-turn-helix domain-containing protein n=1 Tax=Curtobacterium sp. MCBA15_008 TaxID=1898736 RepID=UPI0008DE1AB2|nr:helix-turn-helix domain-containing protein [Curtobacterium sp. MCBA15_008]OII06910.1 hypothetical protein BIU96_04865 [Curtobacterium sp. MCBA15_008]